MSALLTPEQREVALMLIGSALFTAWNTADGHLPPPDDEGDPEWAESGLAADLLGDLLPIDADAIAALRADVTRLTASLAAAEAEAGRLREVAAFYANEVHWQADEDAWEAAERGDLSDDTLSGLVSAVEEDGGQRARAALTGAAS